MHLRAGDAPLDHVLNFRFARAELSANRLLGILRPDLNDRAATKALGRCCDHAPGHGDRSVGVRKSRPALGLASDKGKLVLLVYLNKGVGDHGAALNVVVAFLRRLVWLGSDHAAAERLKRWDRLDQRPAHRRKARIEAENSQAGKPPVIEEHGATFLRDRSWCRVDRRFARRRQPSRLRAL